jgi:hypothetical protein
MGATRSIKRKVTAVAKPIAPLSALVPDWPATAPDNGVELRRTDYDALKEDLIAGGATPEQISTVMSMRKHLIMAALSSSEPAALSVESAKMMIESNFLFPMAKKWVVYPLRRDRTRVITPRDGGGADALKVITRKVPTAAQLKQDAPLPEGGTYLIVYGGSPEIIGLSNKYGVRVDTDVATLLKSVPVADILFRLLEKGEPSALFSLRAGKGEKGGQSLDFPDRAVMKQLRELVISV